MAHPVVIMAYEKSDAIGAAVAALEESGLEVVVLNTAKAKLVNFLGALAGATDEDEDDDAESEEKPKENEDAETNGTDQEDSTETPDASTEPAKEKSAEVTTEGSIEDEKVLIKIVEGSSATLYPSTINIGAKTVYNLNESSFSFWPAAIGNEPIRGGINLSFDGVNEFIQVTFSEEVKNPPVLELGADLVAKLKA